jgi:hypothetical protein
MGRIYRIRDTQRFLFLPLLFPVMPLLLQVLHPRWTQALFLLESAFLLFAFWMMFRERELEIGDQEIRIDRGMWMQRIAHEKVYEIVRIRHNVIHLRMEGGRRVLRVAANHAEAAVGDLQRFARQHAIPLVDRRTRRTGSASRGL